MPAPKGAALGLFIYLEKRRRRRSQYDNSSDESRRRRSRRRGSEPTDGPTPAPPMTSFGGGGGGSGDEEFSTAFNTNSGRLVQFEFDRISNAPSDPGSAQAVQAQLDLLKPHLLSFKAMLWDLEKWIDARSGASPGAMVTEYLEARSRLKQVLLLLEEQAECPPEQCSKISQMLDWSERCLKRFLVSNKTYDPAAPSFQKQQPTTRTTKTIKTKTGRRGRGGVGSNGVGTANRRIAGVKRSHSAPRPTLSHVTGREPGFMLIGFKSGLDEPNGTVGSGGSGGTRRRLPQRGAMFLPDGAAGRFTINRRFLAPISEHPPRRSVSLSGLFDREISTPL